jgi:hypothetical protein
MEIIDMTQQNILEQMREKETEELLEIWNAQDTQTWTPEALEAARVVLTERLGSAPAPVKSVLPAVESDAEIDEEEGDTDLYHEPKRLIWVADLVSKAAWVVLVLALANGLARVFFTLAQSTTFSAILLASGVVNALSPIADGIFYWGLMLIVAELIYLGMDIEFNGRKSSQLLSSLLKRK